MTDTTTFNGINVSNSGGNGYVIGDGFGGPSNGPATFPNGSTITGVQKYTPSVIAAKGSAQGNATAITTTLVEVTATASTEGVILPSGVGGFIYVAIPGTIGAKVYPPSGQQIGTASTNAAIVQAAGKSSLYAQVTSTLWVALKGA